MRARGTTTTRSTCRRPAEVDRGNENGEQVEKGRKRPVAPQHSTFRRVAVFVPLSSCC